MTYIRNHTLTLSIALLMFLGMAYVASASEIQGVLSSDGSTDTRSEASLGETNSGASDATGETVAQSSGRLQGSVVQGRTENDALAMMSDVSTWSPSVWLVLLVGITLGILATFLWRRRVI